MAEAIVKPAPAAAIDALWVAMADCYGHRWVSAYGADPRAGAGGTWARGLSGLTPQQIGQGVDSCIAGAYAWPPTLPEFRALCLGVPPFAAVRAETSRSEPFTRLVWQYLDGHRYRNSSADVADRMMREAYELAREHVMRGGELPKDSEAIEHEEPKPYEQPGEEHRLAVLALAQQIALGGDSTA